MRFDCMRNGFSHLWLAVISMICLTGFATDAVFSQNKSGKLNMAMMDKDLDIMESILDKLMAEDDYRRIHLTHNSTRGVFIPNYGIIFTVPAQPHIFQLLMGEIHALTNEDHISIVNTGKSVATQKPVTREQTESRIGYFLSKYADAIRQLRPDDKITVIYTNQIHTTPGSYWSAMTQKDPGFTVSATFKDIQQFNAGSVGQQEFNTRLSVRPAISLQEKEPEMAIFIHAVQTILSSNAAESFDLRSAISQIHLDEFGMIVSFEANFLSSNSFEYFFSIDPNSPEFTGTQVVRGNKKVGGVNVWSQFSHIDTVSTDKLQHAFADFEKKLIHIIVQYAPTLYISKPNRWLVLAAKINQLNPQIPTRAVYKVQNKNIKAFVDRKIDQDKFLQTIEIYKYYPHQ